MIYRPRVAIVLVGDSMTGSGGAERRFLRLWRAMRHGRPEPILMLNESLFESAVASGLCTQSDRGEDCRVLRDGDMLPFNIDLYNQLRDTGCQIVHLVLLQQRLLPLYAMLSANRELLVTHTVTSSLFAHPGHPPRLRLLLGRFLWKLSDRIDALYEGFIDAYAVPRGFAHKVSITPCSFTDAEQFATASAKSETIVFAGKLDHEKNPLLFIEGLALLKDRSGWRAIVAGAGPLRNETARAIAQAGLADRVTLGVYPDLASVFARSCIFVSLQRTENYPSQSLLEAMAARNAVVATAVGATTRLVDGRRTGILIEPRADQLAGALRALLDDEPRRTEMGRLGREKIIAEHSLERVVVYMRNFWLDLSQKSRLA